MYIYVDETTSQRKSSRTLDLPKSGVKLQGYLIYT